MYHELVTIDGNISFLSACWDSSGLPSVNLCFFVIAISPSLRSETDIFLFVDLNI